MTGTGHVGAYAAAVPEPPRPAAPGAGPAGSPAPADPAGPAELFEEVLEVAGVTFRLLRPADPAALLDEDAFAVDEFLPYWAELWPAARSLAAALPERLEGVRVLELGCGLGLPSLVAARRGAEVVATDWADQALELLATNAARNGVQVARRHLDWTRPPADLVAAPPDLVLAADVAYEQRNVEPLAALLELLGTVTLLADPGRRAGGALLERLASSFERDDLGGGVSRLRPRGSPPR